MRIPSVLFSLLLLGAPALAAKRANKPAAAPTPARPTLHLAELNGLTKILAPHGTIDSKELERLIENGEAIALRDAIGRTSAQAITYTAMLEQQIDSLRGERPLRVLVDLALVTAALANPADEYRQRSYAEAFYKSLLQTLKVNPDEARPRPELLDELAQIGQWSAELVRHLAPKLGETRARISLMRLAITLGDNHQAQELGRGQSEPRVRALYGAALIFDGKASADALAHLYAALAHGGEAAQIARWAWSETMRRRVMGDLGRAFGDRDLGSDGGIGLCRQTTSPSVDQARACAARFWLAGDQSAAIAAAEKTPAVPSWNVLSALVALGKSKDTAQELALRKKIAEQAAALQLGDHDRSLLRVAAGFQAAMMAGEPKLFTKDERALLDRLHHQSPCDPSSLPLRFLALRGDREPLVAFADTIAASCIDRPDGRAATIEGLTVMLELAHGAQKDAASDRARGDLTTVEKTISELADKHKDDADVLALKADMLVLRALGNEKARSMALTAALALYEEALGRLTPLAGRLRIRLESNAAFAAVLLLQNAPKARTVDLERRALKHLRLATAFGDTPLPTAVRAKFGSLAKMTTSGVTPERWPAGPEKRRALCLLGEQARLAGDDKNAGRFAALLGKEATVPSEHAFPELFVEAGGAVTLLVDDRNLRPIVDARTALWFAPACAE